MTYNKSDTILILNKYIFDIARMEKTISETEFARSEELNTKIKDLKASLEDIIKEMQASGDIRFCAQQEIDKEGIYCSAHIAEERVFNCPFSKDEAKSKCSDYKPK